MVLPAFRRKGGGRRLLESVEGKARELGCCKLTLEVMGKNDRACVRTRLPVLAGTRGKKMQARRFFCPNPYNCRMRRCSRLQAYCCWSYPLGQSRFRVLYRHNGTSVPRIAQRRRSLPCRYTPMSRKLSSFVRVHARTLKQTLSIFSSAPTKLF